MKTREWEKIERQSSPEAFGEWLAKQSDTETWRRGDICCCPLHDFVEEETGYDIAINSPNLHEHWAERPTQQWPTPWWMVWMLRSVDHTGKGEITAAQLRAIYRIGVDRDWSSPLMSPEDLDSANDPVLATADEKSPTP